MAIKKNILLFLFTLSLCWGGNSFAVGLGFSVSQSSQRWKDRDLISQKSDHDASSFGVLLDTGVAQRKLFSYRFAFLFEKNNSANGLDKFEGFSTTHDFVFGVFRSDRIRLWFGPRFKVSSYTDIVINGVETKGEVTGLLLGPVAGINLLLSKTVSVSFSIASLAGSYNNHLYLFHRMPVGEVDVAADSTAFNAAIVFPITRRY